MIEIRAIKERGQCVSCWKPIKKGDLYYNLNGTWVHVKCFEIQIPKSKDAFEQAILQSSVKAKDIPLMIQQLNKIRGDNKFDDAKFVSADFVLSKYRKREGAKT